MTPVTNIQLYLSIGVPTLLILGGLLINRAAMKELGTRLGVIESDMRQFYRTVGKLKGRMDSGEK